MGKYVDLNYAFQISSSVWKFRAIQVLRMVSIYLTAYIFSVSATAGTSNEFQRRTRILEVGGRKKNASNTLLERKGQQRCSCWKNPEQKKLCA